MWPRKKKMPEICSPALLQYTTIAGLFQDARNEFKFAEAKGETISLMLKIKKIDKIGRVYYFDDEQSYATRLIECEFRDKEIVKGLRVGKVIHILGILKDNCNTHHTKLFGGKVHQAHIIVEDCVLLCS